MSHRKDACLRGHPYAEHAYYTPDGRLGYCRVCQRERGKNRVYRARRVVAPQHLEGWADRIIAKATWLERKRRTDGYFAPRPPIDLDLIDERIGSSAGDHWQAADWVDYHDYAGRIPAADGPSARSDFLWLKLLELDENAWRYITTEEQMIEAFEVLR